MIRTARSREDIGTRDGSPDQAHGIAEPPDHLPYHQARGGSVGALVVSELDQDNRESPFTRSVIVRVHRGIESAIRSEPVHRWKHWGKTDNGRRGK